MLLDGDTTVGKAGSLSPGEHKVTILVELSPQESPPLAYQREFVVRLGEAKYTKVAVAISAASPRSTDRFRVDTQFHVIEEEQMAGFRVPPGGSAEKRALHAPPPVIDLRLAVLGMSLDNLIRICVDAQGAVESETLVASSNTLFDASVLKGLRQWRFQPLIESGIARPFCFMQRNLLRVTE